MSTLVATTVANARPRDRDYKLSDGGGLYLLMRRDEAGKLLTAGTAPSHQQTVAAVRAHVEENDTFRTVPLEWVAKNEREGTVDITLANIRWLLEKTYPRIGNRPVAKITAQEVLATLRSGEAPVVTRAPAYAQRTQPGRV